MTERLCIVVFSYNRAMQLDCLLRSINRTVGAAFDVVVIYHCSPAHDRSYSAIAEKYQGRVTFLRRTRRNSFVFDILPTFFRFYGNAYWFWRNPMLRNDLDDFKRMFEGLLGRIDAPFVLFFTDDAVVVDRLSVPSTVLAAIRANPQQCSYKALIGANILGAPPNIRLEEEGYCSWNYYDKQSTSHWAWPFAVDGTVYDTGGLREFTRKFIYQSPITLEGFGVKYARHRRLFQHGMSPITSSVISITINRVSTITNNPAADISVDMLMARFLEGFELEYTLPSAITQTALVPEGVRLVRGAEQITLLPAAAEIRSAG